MLRIVFRLLTGLCLIAFIAVIVFWVRSYRSINQQSDADSFSFTHHDPLYWLISHPGHVTLCRQVGRDWPTPIRGFKLIGVNFGGVRGPGSLLWNLVVPYWLLATLLLLPPAVWLRGRYALVASGSARHGECALPAGMT